MIDISIGVMEADDVAEAAQLDSENLSAWTASHFKSLLNQPHNWHFVARTAATHILVGYICGQALLGEAEIHKIAVAKGYRRQHIGHRLLDHALACLKKNSVSSCFLELRASNLAARKLYESFDFSPCGIRKKYYNSPREDAIIMRRQATQQAHALS